MSLCQRRRARAPVAVLALGVRSGTKAKRAQAVCLRDPLMIGLLRWACDTAESPNMPIVHFVEEIGAVMDVPSCDKIIKCTAFEDNNGAIELA